MDGNGQAGKDNETQPQPSWPPAYQPPPLTHTTDEFQKARSTKDDGATPELQVMDKKAVVAFWIFFGMTITAVLIGFLMSLANCLSDAIGVAVFLFAGASALLAVYFGFNLGCIIVKVWCRRLWQRLRQGRTKSLDVRGETERKEQAMNIKPVGIGVSIALAGAVFWLFANRYVMSNAGQGVVYRTNRLTGETTVIRGAQEYPVMNQAEAALAEERAAKARQEAAVEDATREATVAQKARKNAEADKLRQEALALNAQREQAEAVAAKARAEAALAKANADLAAAQRAREDAATAKERNATELAQVQKARWDAEAAAVRKVQEEAAIRRVQYEKALTSYSNAYCQIMMTYAKACEPARKVFSDSTANSWQKYDNALSLARTTIDRATNSAANVHAFERITPDAAEAYSEAISKANGAFSDAVARAGKTLVAETAPAKKAYDSATAQARSVRDAALSEIRPPASP